MPENGSDIEKLKARIQHLEEENRKWMRLAGTNRLTNLPNNLMFYQVVLPRELRKGGSLPVSLVCILICPDGLGEVNQQHGRLVGDQLIGQIGEFLKKEIGEKEQLFHLDGANFAILMFDSSEGNARRKASQIKNDFRDQSFKIDKIEFKNMTFSASVAEIESIIQAKEVAAYTEQFYKDLSNRLYKAKQRGGNAIVGSSAR